MIPVIIPHILKNIDRVCEIKLVRHSDEKLYWNIEYNIIPTLKKQIYEIEITDDFFESIHSPHLKYVFTNAFINILAYNEIDFGHPLKFNFEKIGNKFSFTYFLGKDETITLPALANKDQLKILLCNENKRPCFKLEIADVS